MITKKKALKIARDSESVVYSTRFDIDHLIYLHAELGFFEFEVFVTKELAKKCIPSLEKKGFYARKTEFKSLENECRLHVSWISSF
jgi:hypothetical protein